jgi:hypothetical protein
MIIWPSMSLEEQDFWLVTWFTLCCCKIMSLLGFTLPVDPIIYPCILVFMSNVYSEQDFEDRFELHMGKVRI